MTDTKSERCPEQGSTETTESELPPAARRALEEVAARRRAEKAIERPREYGGRKGLDPVRYGDWEKKGIAIDF